MLVQFSVQDWVNIYNQLFFCLLNKISKWRLTLLSIKLIAVYVAATEKKKILKNYLIPRRIFLILQSEKIVCFFRFTCNCAFPVTDGYNTGIVIDLLFDVTSFSKK